MNASRSMALTFRHGFNLQLGAGALCSNLELRLTHAERPEVLKTSSVLAKQRAAKRTPSPPAGRLADCFITTVLMDSLKKKKQASSCYHVKL